MLRVCGPDTRVDLLTELRRRLVPRAPAAPGSPPELPARIRGVLPPPVHLLHECTINIMDA
jgi:hypothetical protein